MKRKNMIKCPVCCTQFIPKTFYPEEANILTHDGKKTSGFHGYISTSGVKPPEVILNSWITYCPDCNYIMKFVKEIVKKEKIPGKNGSAKDINEKYNNYYFGFPYGDYSQYLREITKKMEVQINEALANLDFTVWQNLYTIDDSFKFLVRFFANLENFCDIRLNLAQEKNIVAKIKKLGLPYEVECLILELNMIKNDLIKGDYELNPEEDKIKIILLHFVFHLIRTHIKPLVSESQLNEDYEFIKFEDFKSEIKNYLGNYLYAKFNSDPISSRQITVFINNLFGKVES